jgi:glycosyltransferase involved in cell wall biosynthesis
MFEGKVRFHSPQRVISEIGELVRRYYVEAIYFAEDMFLSSKQRAKDFMRLLVDSGLNKKIKWFAQIRTNVVDTNLLQLMKKAGCVQVEYGFESGSQRILDMMGKNTTVESNLRAAKITKGIGLRFQSNIIVGYPGEKEEDFSKTVKFIKKIKPNNIGFNIFMPLPGTYIYNKLRQENKPLPRWDEIGDPEGMQINYADMPKGRFEELYFNTRIKVVLPINLYYFIKDNLTNPLRLIRIIVSQFKGVILKAIHSFIKINALKVSSKVLYISYNAVSQPLFQSQGLSYIRELNKMGFEFVLFSFEKQKKRTTAAADEFLKETNIDWRRLRYHKKPYLFSTLWDVLCGSIYTCYLINKCKIKIVHARGIIAVAMAFLPCKIFRRKFVFDIRSSLAEAYATGGYWPRGSLIYKLVKFLEYFYASRSDFLIAETSIHATDICTYLSQEKMPNRLQRLLCGPVPPIEIIPCCVDLRRFKCESVILDTSQQKPNNKKFRLLYIGALSGWYMLDEMLDFFAVLKEKVQNCEFIFFTNDEYNRITNKIMDSKVLCDAVRVYSISYTKLPRESIQMDVGIVFTKPGGRLESMPIKIGEYLASGLSVVLNKGMGDAEELIRRNKIGVIIEEFNADAYRKAVDELLYLMRDKEIVKERCRKVVQDYLFLQKGVEKYSRIYKKLICDE